MKKTGLVLALVLGLLFAEVSYAGCVLGTTSCVRNSGDGLCYTWMCDTCGSETCWIFKGTKCTCPQANENDNQIVPCSKERYVVAMGQKGFEGRWNMDPAWWGGGQYLTIYKVSGRGYVVRGGTAGFPDIEDVEVYGNEIKFTSYHNKGMGRQEIFAQCEWHDYFDLTLSDDGSQLVGTFQREHWAHHPRIIGKPAEIFFIRE